MAVKTGKILIIATCGLLYFTSCNKSTEKNTEKPVTVTKTSEKTVEKPAALKEWSQADRTEFLTGCIQSASASYKSRGEKPNIELVTNICTCTGQDLEAKYSYADANKISKEEIKDFITAAATRCGPGVE